MGTRTRWLIAVAVVAAGLWWFFGGTRSKSPDVALGEGAAGTVEQDLDIVTLLPKDAIPAIFDPSFFSPDEADDWYSPEELVLGVEINGDARAYSIPYLSRREIVNDTVGGRKIAVTW